MSGRCVWKVSGSTWQVDIRKITNDDVSQLHLRNSQPRNGAQDGHKMSTSCKQTTCNADNFILIILLILLSVI